MVQLSWHYFQKSHFLEPSPWPTFPQLLCLMLSASFSALDETEKSLLTEQISELPYANPACEALIGGVSHSGCCCFRGRSHLLPLPE